METVSRSEDLKNGHMINVLVEKFPTKEAHDWAEHKQEKNLDNMDSEEIFRELMLFMKAKKEVTKALIRKRENSTDKSKTQLSFVTGQTFTIQQQRVLPKPLKGREKKSGQLEPLCMVCKDAKNPQDVKHWTTECEIWRGLNLADRKRIVRCHRHLQAGLSHDPGKCSSMKISK